MSINVDYHAKSDPKFACKTEFIPDHGTGGDYYRIRLGGSGSFMLYTDATQLRAIVASMGAALAAHEAGIDPAIRCLPCRPPACRR